MKCRAVKLVRTHHTPFYQEYNGYELLFFSRPLKRHKRMWVTSLTPFSIDHGTTNIRLKSSLRGGWAYICTCNRLMNNTSAQSCLGSWYDYTALLPYTADIVQWIVALWVLHILPAVVAIKNSDHQNKCFIIQESLPKAGFIIWSSNSSILILWEKGHEYGWPHLCPIK